MSDTKILDDVIGALKWHVERKVPLSPMAAHAWLDEIMKERYPERRVDTSELRVDPDECKPATS